MVITRKDIFQVWRNAEKGSGRNGNVISHVLSWIGLNNTEKSDECEKVKQIVRKLCSKFSEKWINAKRTIGVFESRNQEWLNECISLSIEDPMPSRQLGRPLKTFMDSRIRSKTSKVSPLVQNNTKEELLVAASVSFYKSGKRNAAQILKVLNKSPNRSSKMKRVLSCSPLTPTSYTPEEALALYVDGRYTKNSYILMQSGAKSRNANIYPSYNVLREAKKRCYPEKSSMSATDVSAEVGLQALVDHTVRRIVEVQKEVITKAITESSIRTFNMTYKWGCDGSSGHSNYKQKFSESDENKTDEYLFAVCLVPLQLKVCDIVVWQNPRPSSTRFCRPIKILFEKETDLLIKKDC